MAITLSVALAGCGEPSGEPAQPATLDGLPTKLADAEPCIWNGDSGCTGHQLRRRDPVLCVLHRARVEFDAGAPARDAIAVAGQLRKQQFPIPTLSERGRVELPVQRIDGRRFIVSAEEPLPSSVRVLQIHVRYSSGVLTPYTPTDDSQTTRGRREQFKSGVYALRVRSRRGKECTKVAT
jgi:hypothetical protein